MNGKTTFPELDVQLAPRVKCTTCNVEMWWREQDSPMPRIEAFQCPECKRVAKVNAFGSGDVRVSDP